MKPIFYGHPFSSYTQKVLIALYENQIDFEYRDVDPEFPGVSEALAALWPMKRFPILVDAGRTILESSTMIEYLDLHYAGPTRFLPPDPRDALEIRMMDRIFDNYVMTPMQKFAFNRLRPEEHRDPYGVEEARKMLDTAFAWLDETLASRLWAAGERFTLADCAAAPSLFYADWVHEIDPRFTHLKAYRARLLARPSFARAIEEGRRYRHYFPGGAPDRD